MLKDNFDREALVDAVLLLETKYALDRSRSDVDTLSPLPARYYLKKVKLIESLKEVLRNTYYPDLRNQLIRMIARIMARRPRMSLFENKIFECYHLEINNLDMMCTLVNEVLTDLNQEEKLLMQHKHKLYPTVSTDKLGVFYD